MFEQIGDTLRYRGDKFCATVIVSDGDVEKIKSVVKSGMAENSDKSIVLQNYTFVFGPQNGLFWTFSFFHGAIDVAFLAPISHITEFFGVE